MSKRLDNAIPQRIGPWFGSGIVVLGAVFLSLTVSEGSPSGYQSVVDFVFHSGPLMAAATTVLWLARRGYFGNLPRIIRAIATILLPFFGIFTFFAFVNSPMVWTIAEPLGVSRRQFAPIAVLVASALFVVGGTWLLIRGLFRWIGGRYRHQGFAVGVGPVYFYFRRRRTKLVGFAKTDQ